MTDSPTGSLRFVRGAGLLAVGLLAGVLIMRGVGSFMPGARQSTITQSVIVDRRSLIILAR